MPNDYYNPIDPTQPHIYNALPESQSSDDVDTFTGTNFFCVVLYLLSIIAGFVIVLAAMSFFSSCTTTKKMAYAERHRMESIMNRMDSVINTRQINQQDSTFRETVLHQLQTIKERSDTSRTVVVDSAGKIIKETVIIRTEKESNSETDRHDREVIAHRLEVLDSTLAMMRLQQLQTDSLLQTKQTTVEREVEKPLTKWQQLRLWFGNIVLVAFAILAAVWAFKKRVWWLSLLRKLF